MKNCEHYQEKIVFFDDLSDRERQDVLKHVAQCLDCEKKLLELQTLSVSLSRLQTEHPFDDTLLERYSIYLEAPEEPDYDGSRLSSAQIESIRTHIAACRNCEQKVELFRKEYREVLAFIEQTEVAKLKSTDSQTSLSLSKRIAAALKSIVESLKSIFSPASPAFYPATAGLAFALLLLLWFGPFFRDYDDYRQLATIGNTSISLTTRSAQDQLLTQGISAFESGAYQKAIPELEAYLSANPGAANQFDFTYALGFSYLATAKNSFLGRFPKIDTEHLNQSLKYLQLAEGLSDNVGLKEECYWQLGQAWLLQGDGTKAKDFFEKAAELKGKRYGEALEMIEKIDAMTANR